MRVKLKNLTEWVKNVIMLPKNLIEYLIISHKIKELTNSEIYRQYVRENKK